MGLIFGTLRYPIPFTLFVTWWETAQPQRDASHQFRNKSSGQRKSGFQEALDSSLMRGTIVRQRYISKAREEI
jgi:hypothetical protein